MLRPSCSGVSGLGRGRPSRVPIPAARTTTCTGRSCGRVAGRAARGAKSSRAGVVVVRSAVLTVAPSSGRGDRAGGSAGRREEQVEDTLGGVPVLQGGVGLPEGAVPLGGGGADRVE